MRLLIAVLALLTALPSPASAEPEWALLGPTGPRPVLAAAALDGVDGSRLIVGARDDGLVRSRDGGANWELIPRSTDRIVRLAFVGGPGSRELLAITRISGSGGTSLVRSSDDGGTWHQVLSTERELTLALPPSDAPDGPVFAVADGRAWRGRSGVDWSELTAPMGQLFTEIHVSPAYASDHVVFAAAATLARDARGFLLQDRLGDEHATSTGVAMSTDDGNTWTPLGAGMVVEGAPFRYVRALSVSPTFSRDGTIFASVWGPPAEVEFSGQKIKRPNPALLRSTDRGKSWTVVRPASGLRSLAAMSPRFADDGMAVLVENRMFVSPASSNCTVLVTRDRGDTWEQVQRPGSYEACQTAIAVHDGAMPTFVVQKGPGWLYSADGGVTWPSFRPPGGGVATVLGTTPLADPVQPSIMVTGAIGGVWLFGSSGLGTSGSLPCDGTVQDGFARAYAADMPTRAALGCPVGAESPTRVYERRLADGRAVWLEGVSGEWFKLRDSRFDTLHSFSVEDATKGPIPAGDEIVAEGAFQQFDGGRMIFLSRPDGRRSIIVLRDPYRSALGWIEYPD